MLPFILKISAAFVFLVYLSGFLYASSSPFQKEAAKGCKTCAETPLGEVPHSGENDEETPCESEESQEELKEAPLASALNLHFSLHCNTFYSFEQIALFSPYRNIFSPPPEALFLS